MKKETKKLWYKIFIIALSATAIYLSYYVFNCKQENIINTSWQEKEIENTATIIDDNVKEVLKTHISTQEQLKDTLSSIMYPTFKNSLYWANIGSDELKTELIQLGSIYNYENMSVQVRKELQMLMKTNQSVLKSYKNDLNMYNPIGNITALKNANSAIVYLDDKANKLNIVYNILLIMIVIIYIILVLYMKFEIKKCNSNNSDLIKKSIQDDDNYYISNLDLNTEHQILNSIILN